MPKLAALLLVIAAVFAACGGGDTKPPRTSTQDGSPSAVVPSTGTPAAANTTATPVLSPVPDPVAQAVTKGNFQLTLNGAIDPYVPTDDIDAAEDGYRWVLIDVSLKNVSAEEQPYGPEDFFVVDGDGEEWDPFPAGQTQELLGGLLAAGASERGQLAFEVPDGASVVRLAFSPDLDPETEIDITLP